VNRESQSAQWQEPKGTPLGVQQDTTRISARWYFWIFCIYLETTLHWIFRRGSSAQLPHLDVSFYILFNLIFVPLFCAWLALSFVGHTRNWVERAILILTATVFVLNIASALHRLDYFPPYLSPRVSNWISFVATILLGYRTDQVLKNQDKRIEAIECSTPS
jgi:hypothetical protein